MWDDTFEGAQSKKGKCNNKVADLVNFIVLLTTMPLPAAWYICMYKIGVCRSNGNAILYIKRFSSTLAKFHFTPLTSLVFLLFYDIVCFFVVLNFWTFSLHLLFMLFFTTFSAFVFASVVLPRTVYFRDSVACLFDISTCALVSYSCLMCF